MITNYEAIIFDLDGTLIDSMKYWKKIDEEFLIRRGIVIYDDLLKEIEGMSFTDTTLHFKNKFNLVESLDELIDEWINIAENYFKHEIELKRSVKMLLSYIAEANIPMGIGTSNTRVLAEASLSKHKVRSYFSSIRTSCEVGTGKPNPSIFLKVAEDLKVDPSRCLVFEDSLAGVMAAKNAGMDVVAIYDESSSALREDIEKIVVKYIFKYDEILTI